MTRTASFRCYGPRCSVFKADNESSILAEYFIHACCFTGKFCVLTRKTELGINSAVAFYLANFDVDNVR
jgi:hypothetical protein